MRPILTSLLRPFAIPLAAIAALGGCSTMELKEQTVAETAIVKAGPEQQPFRSITGFSSALRCMDNLMIDYGVRDVSMLVEDILDQTKKVNAGTRDMLITAVSDMTRRSRAIRVVAFGRDATNVISFLASAQRQGAYEVVPQYDIKGSVTQFDENLIRNQKDVGAGWQPFINLGVSRDAASSVLGLDLSVLTTDDMAVLPGVTSRNSVVILKQGRGLDGDAAYHKLGVNFSMNLSKSEGQAQALRGLVELAVIELMGKLTKTPYWRCLGADAEHNDEIAHEISDWYYTMASSRVELIGYFQHQLRRRGFYDGPIDGAFKPAFDEAIANYRAAIGMSKEAKLDEPLFKAYLAADHGKVVPPAKPAALVPEPPSPAPGVKPTPPVAAAAPAAPAAPASKPVPAATPSPAPAATPAPQPALATPKPPAEAAEAQALRLLLASANHQTRFAKGEPINLSVRPSRDAHVYCYLQDDKARIVRFYPNRFAKDSLVPAAKPLALPGEMRFQLVMNDRGVVETIACYATARDVLTRLPKNVVGADFEALPLVSLEQVRNEFVHATGGAVTEETFHVRPR